MITAETGAALPMMLENVEGHLKMHNEGIVDAIENDQLQPEPLQPEPLQREQLQPDLSNNDMSHNDSLQQDESMMEATIAEGISEEKVIDENSVPQSLDMNHENGLPQNLEIENIKPSSEHIEHEPIVDEESLIYTKPMSLKEESRSAELPNIVDDAPIPNVVKDNQISASDLKLDEDVIEAIKLQQANVDPHVKEQQELIENSTPETVLEVALFEELNRKESHVQRLSGEVMKLKAFISKRKQTYKRKRKDEGAPTRALSAYNIFVQDRFSKLAKENEAALKSADSDAQLKRVPPASLVASTGNQWKELTAKDKSYYEDRAKTDRKRYDDQMAKYQPPDKQANRKRNKTGYNMFFSAHVLRLKQSEAGVPSERGSVARLVGNAWKELTPEDKQYYEREADKQNGMNSGDEEERIAKDEERRPEYPPVPTMGAMDPNMHRQSMPQQMGHAPVVHQQSHHDPRVHYPPPGPPGHYQAYPGYYDYHQPPPPPQQGGQGQRGNQQRSHHPGGYQYHPSHYPPYHEQGQI